MLDTVKLLVTHGVDVNVRNLEGKDAFMYISDELSSHRHKEIREELLKIAENLLRSGAYIDFDKCLSLIFFAIKLNSVNLVDLFIHHGLDVDTKKLILAKRYTKNYDCDSKKILTRRDYILKITDEELKYQREMVLLLPYRPQQQGNTLLTIACFFKHYDMAKMLVGNNASLSEVFASVKNSFPSICEEVFFSLIEIGVDVNTQDINGDTMLIIASQKNEERVVKELIRHHANLEVRNLEGATALQVAYYCCSEKAIDVLVRAGATIKDKCKLPYAATTNNASLAKQIIEYSKLKVKEKEIALLESVRCNSVEVAKVIVQSGLHEKYCKEALIYAIVHDSLEAVQFLIIFDDNIDKLLCEAARQNALKVLDFLITYTYSLCANNEFYNASIKEYFLKALCEAIRYYNRDVVVRILRTKIDVNCKLKDGSSLLVLAVKYRAVDIVHEFLIAGASLDEKALSYATSKNYIEIVEMFITHRGINELYGKMMLKIAINNSYNEIVELLLKAHVNPDVCCYLENNFYCPVLIKAIQNYDVAIVKMLLDSGADVNQKSSERETAYTVAKKLKEKLSLEEPSILQDKQLRQIQKILELLNNNINLKYDDGNTLLHKAVQNGSLEEIKELLENNANIYIANDEGVSPISMVLQQNLKNILKLFAKHEDIGILFLWAVRFNSKDAMQFLFDLGADVNVTDDMKKTSLMYAAENRALEIVELLIEHSINVNLQDEKGKTALMYAAENRALKIVELLIEHSVDVNSQDEKGKTALIYAIEKKSLEIVSLLIEHSADINLQDLNGITSLEYAACELSPEIVHIILKVGGNVNKQFVSDALLDMLETNCVDELDKEEETNLINIVDMLIKENIDLNAKWEDGCTALMYACMGGHIDVVQLLIEAGADINANDSLGQNALMYAIDENAPIQIIKMLIEAGADVNAKDNDGHDVLWHAKIMMDNPEKIIKLLQSAGTK